MRDSDWDLLADHLGGVLDGTAEQRRVTNLIATDPEWARAAARLSGAFDAVAADLATLPEAVMPDDILARMDAALHTATGTPPRDHGATPVPARSSAGRGGRRAGGPGGAAHHPASHHPAARRPARRRRTGRWLSGLVVVAGLMAFAAFGVPMLNTIGEDRAAEDGAVTSGAPGGDAGPGQGQGFTDSQPQLLASGTDYHRSRLPGQADGGFDGERNADPPPDEPGVAGMPEPAPEGVPAQVPPALRHLWPAPERCLAAVADSYAAGGATIEVVDFAYFEGRPALVIWIKTQDGMRWVSVSGEDCGDPLAGPDELHRAPAG